MRRGRGGAGLDFSWGLESARSLTTSHISMPGGAKLQRCPQQKGRTRVLLWGGSSSGKKSRRLCPSWLTVSINRPEKILPNTNRANSLSGYANHFLDSLEETPKPSIHFTLTDSSSRKSLCYYSLKKMVYALHSKFDHKRMKKKKPITATKQNVSGLSRTVKGFYSNLKPNCTSWAHEEINSVFILVHVEVPCRHGDECL